MKIKVISFAIGIMTNLFLSNSEAQNFIKIEPSSTLTIDMRNSTFFGLKLNDKKKKVLSILGKPEFIGNNKLYYPSFGVSIDLIKNRIHSVYVWLGDLGSEEAFDQYSSNFHPPNVEVITPNGSIFTVKEDLSIKELQNLFGNKGWIDGPDSEGYTGIGYNAKSPDGPNKLLLNFEFPNSKGLKGLWLVH